MLTRNERFEADEIDRRRRHHGDHERLALRWTSAVISTEMTRLHASTRWLHATGMSAADVEPLLTRYRGSRACPEGARSDRTDGCRRHVAEGELAAAARYSTPGFQNRKSQLMVHNGDHYPARLPGSGVGEVHGRRGVRR